MGEHALFVTVLANFRIFDTLPFSQSKSEYISKTLLPSCLLVKIVDGTSDPFRNVLSVGLRGPFEIVPDRLGSVPAGVLGVRAPELLGLWYA